MAIAFTVSLSGVAAAVTGNPMAPYREVLQAVRMAPSDAQVSAEQGVEIGRDLGAANAALQRGDTESANKFIDEAEASIEEHIEDNEGDEDSFVAELQDEVVELRQDAEAVAAAASQDPVIADGDEGAEEALPVPGDSSDDPGASAPPSGETAAEDGLGSADPGSEASATADTAISGPTPGSATASSDTSPSGEPTSSNSPSPSPSSTTKSPTSPPSGSNSPTTMPSGSTSPTAAGTTKSSTSKPSSPTSSTSPPTTSGSPSGTSETASASTPREMI